MFRCKLPTAHELDTIFNSAVFHKPDKKFHYDTNTKPKSRLVDQNNLCLYYHGLHQPLHLPKYTQTEEHSVKQIGLTRKWLQLNYSNCMMNSTISNMWQNFSRTLNHLPNFYQTSVVNADKHLVKLIRKAGYITKRTMKELEEEVLTRRKQYPRQQIYCFVGYSIYRYIQDLYDDSWMDVNWIA